MTLTITPIFVAIALVLQAIFMFPIGPLRGKLKIAFWGGDDKLDRLVRGHGNFTENAPVILLGLGTAEIMGANSVFLWGFGVAFAASRIAHYLSLQGTSTPFGSLIGRIGGTLATLLIMAGLAILIGWRLIAA